MPKEYFYEWSFTPYHEFSMYNVDTWGFIPLAYIGTGALGINLLLKNITKLFE